jgi:stage V sporulation protein AD
MVNAGYINHTAACVSSHFCTAERQFRTPLEYGAQRTPTAQWTVTGAGCAIIGTRRENAPFITAATIGAIKDGGITDANNMGAAMAPAAFETIYTHMKNTGTSPKDYDMIATGDLGHVGARLLRELFEMEGISLENRLFDCGCEIFDSNTQDTHAGGSGAACSAVVFCAHIVEEIKKRNLKRVLFAGTGALQSVLSVQQKESIPAICHLIELSV